MITLYEFLKLMSLDSELTIFDDEGEALADSLVSGTRDTIDLPMHLYNAPVTYFVPGIVTMIFIKEPKQ